jgi:hypothetical protein
MTIPTNRMSYADIYPVYDKALEDPKGIRIPFDTRAEAQHYQMRLHNARSVDRRENAKIYPDKGHKMHGQSVYDVLQVRIKQGEDGTHFIYIEPKDKYINLDEMESLSEIETDEGENEDVQADTN